MAELLLQSLLVSTEARDFGSAHCKRHEPRFQQSHPPSSILNIAETLGRYLTSASCKKNKNKSKKMAYNSRHSPQNARQVVEYMLNVATLLEEL